MNTLEGLQTALQQHLLGQDSGIADALVAGRGIDTARRLQIYHHAYRMRLVDTLRDSFGHTLVYLGDDWFNADALAYVEGHPSDHPNLRWYGAAFAPWLHERHAADPDIAELATLDWALRKAFDGPDAPVLAMADLAAVPADAWATLGLVLHPTAARLRLTHNTLAIWQALDQDQAPPPAQPLPQPTELLVWRRELSPHFRSLSVVEAGAIDMLRERAGFAATCAMLAERFPDADIASEAGTLLRRWVDEGLLSALRADA